MCVRARMLRVSEYVIRAAQERDLDAIAAFEVEIARVSFGDEAITGAAFHRRRVAGSLGKPGEVTLIAASSDDQPAGWAWLSARTNSLTGERYGNFRSLAAADGPDRGLIAEQLMAAVLAAADEAGLTHLTGKVHAANVGMRALYRVFGFTATHITMERRTRELPMIKCVIWDLDNTLFDGVYLESAAGQRPAADPALTTVLTELAARGILHAIASRNPPEAAEHAEQVTGHTFAAVRCGWDPKPAAVTSIMSELGLAAEAVAFVDDDALERAQVAYALPGVLVLAPDDMADAASLPQFSPPVLTDEARRRGEIYANRLVRQEEARAFGGSRDDFLRYSRTEVTIARAVPADVPRLHELSVRTHQFNSRGTVVAQAALRKMIESLVITVRLRDRFGDDGLVGGSVISGEPDEWEVPLLMLCCRAMGRGVIDALLAWLCRAAARSGARQVTVPCVINPRNVPLRVALAAAGFRAPTPSGETAMFSRRLDGELPELPDWVRDVT